MKLTFSQNSDSKEDIRLNDETLTDEQFMQSIFGDEIPASVVHSPDGDWKESAKQEAIIDGINYRLNKDNQTAEVIAKESYDGDIVIPETVVFNDVTYRVTTIEELSFAGCTSLTSITIPDSVTNIGEYAFRDCKSLTDITIGNGVRCLEEGTFLHCESLTNIKLPQDLFIIGDGTFLECTSLTSVILPVIIGIIGDDAFSGCESLSTIHYAGTIAQWKEIILHEDWNAKVPATVVHCTDGDVEI